jgi:hypothetical protein
MPSHPARLLCTGTDPGLLRTRCAVLKQAGYEAQPATLSEAEVLLRVEQFDLVIVSAWLSDWDRGRILAAAEGRTLSYVLPGVTPANDLLAQVERLLPHHRPAQKPPAYPFR